VEGDKPNDQAMEAEREAVPGGEARWTLHNFRLDPHAAFGTHARPHRFKVNRGYPRSESLRVVSADRRPLCGVATDFYQSEVSVMIH
jgi:hypothetical protein